MNSRDEVLSLLSGRRLGRLPAFSGLPSVILPGLQARGLAFGALHADAAGMAEAAASSYEQFGFESAAAPFDLCVEAEALGCAVDLRAGEAAAHPLVTRRLGDAPEAVAVRPPEDLARAGRLPVVAEALRRLRAGVGREVVVGACLPGPFTLAWQIVETEPLLMAVPTPQRVAPLLEALADFLARVGLFYHQAGADFITVHEMGGSPQVVGPAAFRRLILPPLRRLLASLPAPRVVSVCGHTQRVIADLAASGADALSVDQRCDLAQARQALGPSPLLFGNLDPVGLLAEGAPAEVEAAVQAVFQNGADAVWPGCDLWLETPAANLSALVQAARGLERRP